MIKHTLYLIFFLVSSTCFLEAQEWTQLSSLPEEAVGRNHPVTFAIGDVGYTLTGNGQSETNDVLADMYRYDPENDSWTQMEDFPGGARGYSYGVTYEAKAYVGFGERYDTEDDSKTRVNDLWEFDPETETWTELTSCPCIGRNHPAMIQDDGFIYMGLGSGQDVGDVKDWWRYEISTDTWHELPDFPSTERHHPYYFAIDGLIYVGFGHYGDFIYNDFYRYDPANESWEQLADFPGQGRVAGTQFNYNGKGYIISGQGEDHSNLEEGEFWEYDPETDSWLALLSHPSGGRWAPGSFMIENRLYYFGGEGDTNEKDLWVYEFEVAVIEPTSIESTSNLSLSVFPTLLKKDQSQEVVIETDEKLTFNLYSKNGREVKIDESSNMNGRIELRLQLASGIYFLSYQNELGNKGVSQLQVY